jgi:hypothetical protein
VRRSLALAVACVLSLACSRDKDTPRELPSSELKKTVEKAPPCDGGMCGGTCAALDRDPENCGACGVTCPKAQGCIAGMCTHSIAGTVTVRGGTVDAGTCPVGRRQAYRCLPGGTYSTVWGTDVYTDDSSICGAAAHAGKIALGSGGDVAIEVRAGESSYAPSTRNGVTSNAWGMWTCSFVFVGATCSQTKCGDDCADLLGDPRHCGACGHACGPDETCRKGVCKLGTPASWSATASDRPCAAGTTWVYECPPSGTLGSAVWGTDVYTNDSAICVAAVHAGKTTEIAGGSVTIEIRPGLPAYKASTRNGVTTMKYGPWSCSYVFK